MLLAQVLELNRKVLKLWRWCQGKLRELRFDLLYYLSVNILDNKFLNYFIYIYWLFDYLLNNPLNNLLLYHWFLNNFFNYSLLDNRFLYDFLNNFLDNLLNHSIYRFLNYFLDYSFHWLLNYSFNNLLNNYLCLFLLALSLNTPLTYFLIWCYVSMLWNRLRYENLLNY